MQKKFYFIHICVIFILVNTTVIVCAQNVGIGTGTPAVPLHLKSTTASDMIRIDGNNPYISFFNAGLYKGYLWHDGSKLILGTPNTDPLVISSGYSTGTTFTSGGFVGINKSIPTERLDVAGNINLSGVLKIDGSAGTVGQVLTSNGTGSPQWKNAAFNNNTRFAVNFQELPAPAISGDMQFNLVRYNVNPADISIGSSTITINRSGLYHFNIGISGHVSFIAPVPYSTSLNCWFYVGEPQPYKLLNGKVYVPWNDTKTELSLEENISLEIQIIAPASLRINYSYNCCWGNHSLEGYLTGHLISD